jgi:hypothetical protein
MRKLPYLSPSQLGLFESNREEYYLKHLAEVRAPKIPQATYMAIGSSFDAYVKSALHASLFGAGVDPRFEFQSLFESQVEEQNRDWALQHGSYVFDSYKISGAYDELLKLLEQSKCAPQFEFTIEGSIENVPMLGKPDLRFIHQDGAHIILDWKCNGYCSKSPTSPCKNYRLVRDGWTIDVASASRGCNQPHKGYAPMQWKNVEIHSGWLEEASLDWADQLSMYSWMLGEPVGDENVIVCIDQIVAKPTDCRPLLRIANHRARISSAYQKTVMERLKVCWTAIETGYIFTDLTREENDERCELLNQQAMRIHLDTPEQQYINEITRQPKYK